MSYQPEAPAREFGEGSLPRSRFGRFSRFRRPHVDIRSVKRSLTIALHALGAACVTAALISCSSGGSYHAPPTTVRAASIMQARVAPTAVLIVGDFENPERAQLNWRTVGTGMSEALSRALLDRGRYDVVIKPALSQQLLQLAGKSVPERDPSLEQVRSEHPEVDYVIIGAVTDFHHTTDLPVEIRPKNWIGHPIDEAIVAIDLVVVDVQNERLVAADHITGTARAGKTPTRELYRNVGFGSYVFWNTPLGEASRSAIANAVARIDALIPGVPAMPTYAGRTFGTAHIAQIISVRGVAITGGRDCGLLSEQVYALLPQAASVDDEGNLLRDQSTGKLLLVRIDESRGAEATGWLLGKCSDPRKLLGAQLRPVPSDEDPPRTAEPILQTAGAVAPLSER